MDKRIFILLTLTAISFPDAKAQSLEYINDKLTSIYDQVFENIDTANINYRKESADLIKSGNHLMKKNGHTTLALLEFYRNKYDNAIAEFKKAIQLDSLCYICYNRLHWAYRYGKKRL